MIKRTIVLSNPAYLNTRNEQLLINYPNTDEQPKSLAIEDLGVLVLENPQLTITNVLLSKLLENNVCVIQCDEKHMPKGVLLPLEGHSEQSERYKHHINASEPLKKNLWQQTVSAKIENQATLLAMLGKPNPKILYLSKHVLSGDPQNLEGQAAALYWPQVFGLSAFKRDPDGFPPNHLLNYGYAILRAITARALVSSGLLPTLGIFHKNKYNAFCLADDVMEPYRPFVDLLVKDLVDGEDDYFELNKAMKQHLLQLPVLDVEIDGKKSPLMLAMSRTTASLYECYAGNCRKILYPKHVGTKKV